MLPLATKARVWAGSLSARSATSKENLGVIERTAAATATAAAAAIGNVAIGHSLRVQVEVAALHGQPVMVDLGLRVEWRAAL